MHFGLCCRCRSADLARLVGNFLRQKHATSLTQSPSQHGGRFELVKRISAGGMAEVFLARDPLRNGELVALKKILPHLAADDEFIEMFEDEGRIASRLEHPHIARTLDFGRTPAGDYFISFEFVSGRDLRAVFNACTQLGQSPPLGFVAQVFVTVKFHL